MATTVPSTKRLLPVIHCVDPYTEGGIGHALANTKIALENGADGVFLIGHGMQHGDLIYIYEQVRKQNPDAWVGVNFLDLTTSNIQKEKLLGAIKRCVALSAIWMDALPEEDLGISPRTEIFAGVAFKGQNSRADGEKLRGECTRASAYADVATTSGSRTGSPPKIEKLRAIYELLGESTPLAVASGVKEENAAEILLYARDILVSSSISETDTSRGGHEYLAPAKVRALADIAHRHRPL